MTVTLWYFPVRGRAESVRYALEHSGVDWEEKSPTFDDIKDDLDHYHFSQAPRIVDGDVDITQTQAILRHVARKHAPALYGANIQEAARVDEAIEGAVDLAAVFVNKMRPASTHEDPAKGLELREAYWATHADPDLTASRVGLPDTRGAHLGYLDLLLRKSSTGWVAGGEGPTIADFALAQTIESHLYGFGRERLTAQWPNVVALVDRVHALPRIAAYLQSPRRHAVLTPWFKTAEEWESGLAKEKPSWWAERPKPPTPSRQEAS